MAAFLVNGPCPIFAAVGTAGLGAVGGGLSLVGFSERGVKVSTKPGWEEVMCDLLGPKVPMDLQTMAEEVYVSCDLKLINLPIFEQCMNRANPFTGTRGRIAPGDVGSLINQEGLAYRLLVYCPYGGGQAGTKLSQNVAGNHSYNFLAATLIGPEDFDPLGTQTTKVRAVWRCLPRYNATDSSFTVYNFDTTGVPAFTI